MKKEMKKKCVTITPEQDEKIRAIQVRRTMQEHKTVSFSKVIQSVITEGLKHIR
jgi:hypothetical protein